MTRSSKTLAFVVASTALVAIGGAADARATRHHAAPGRERIHMRATLAPSSQDSIHVARLDLRRVNLQRQSIRLQVDGAQPGAALEIFVADAQGTLRPVASM